MTNAARARELFHYDAATGLFWWRDNSNKNRRMHTAVGHVIKTGYRYIVVDGKRYRAHRLAWLYFYGEWPSGELDHINGDRDDNRITNLRIVTRVQNLANRVHSNNSNGHIGIRPSRHGTRWRAGFVLAGVRYNVGTFATKAEAISAYKLAKDAAKRQLFT